MIEVIFDYNRQPSRPRRKVVKNGGSTRLTSWSGQSLPAIHVEREFSASENPPLRGEAPKALWGCLSGVRQDVPLRP